MSKCPICECDATELWELLEAIDDLAVLNGLACDMAERVANLTPDPAQSKVWIAAARAGQITQAQADRATAAWEQATSRWGQTGEECGIHHPLEHAESATRAVTFIAPEARVQAARGELEEARDRAWEAAVAEGETAIDLEAEQAWQMCRAREAACTCAELRKEQERYEHRSRVSLLAG